MHECLSPWAVTAQAPSAPSPYVSGWTSLLSGLRESEFWADVRVPGDMGPGPVWGSGCSRSLPLYDECPHHGRSLLQLWPVGGLCVVPALKHSARHPAASSMLPPHPKPLRSACRGLCFPTDLGQVSGPGRVPTHRGYRDNMGLHRALLRTASLGHC